MKIETPKTPDSCYVKLNSDELGLIVCALYSLREFHGMEGLPPIEAANALSLKISTYKDNLEKSENVLAESDIEDVFTGLRKVEDELNNGEKAEDEDKLGYIETAYNLLQDVWFAAVFIRDRLEEPRIEETKHDKA